VPIVGGGPAGMSCALWLHNYGLSPLIIEQEDALGGMARMSPYPNEWLLGQRGKTGLENAAEFAAHIHALGVEIWLGVGPQHLRQQEEHWRLELGGEPAPRSLSAAAIVIAGKVRGNLSATTHLDILPSGVLTGTLKAGRFADLRRARSSSR